MEINLLEGKEDSALINPWTSLTSSDVPAFTCMYDIKQAIPNGNKADTKNESSNDGSSQVTLPLRIRSTHNDSFSSDDENEANKAIDHIHFGPHAPFWNFCS